MPQNRTPIGQMHARDFDTYRQQRSLSELVPDIGGYIRFGCLHGDCQRTGKIPLAVLQARYRPQAGLVDILNALRPKDCPKGKPDPSGSRRCGWCYRGLG